MYQVQLKLYRMLLYFKAITNIIMDHIMNGDNTYTTFMAFTHYIITRLTSLEHLLVLLELMIISILTICMGNVKLINFCLYSGVERVLKESNCAPWLPVIVLAHNPRVAHYIRKSTVADRVDLIISGENITSYY
jgi:hypothetical protein